MNVAVTGILPMNEVTTDSMPPVTVVMKELMVLVEVLDVVVLEVRVAVLKESEKELLTPGEQPTKLGADSLTAVQDAMLNAMASASH